MIGLYTIRNGREYRILDHVVISLVMSQQRFVLEGTGYIYSFHKIKEGIEYDFTVSEFEEPTGKISQEDDFAEIDHDFEKEVFSEENQLRLKRQEFRRLEKILKQERLI